MKILFHGSKDSGGVMLIALLLLYASALLIIPLAGRLSVSLSSEKKMYEELCEKIMIQNEEVRNTNEID